MAAKLTVALACLALCNANPVFLKGYIFRNGRGYSVGQGYTSNAGGKTTGSATINGGVLEAYGSATSDGHSQLGRNAFGLPGATVAKAEVYDGPEAPTSGDAKAVSEKQNIPIYYTVPVPGTIISYEHNFETPTEIRYEYPGTIAQSSAILNDNSESITSARAEGTGSAESTAKTQGTAGTNGITSSNAKTLGSGFGAASSKANNDYGNAVTAARTHGFGSAFSKSETDLGMTSATTKTNGGSATSSANNALNSAVVSATSHGTASSKADINTAQGVVVPVKYSNLKGTGWRFGTDYDVPTPGQAQVSSQANGGSAKSTAHTDGIVTTADAQGYGSANANANLHSGYANSAANSNGLGYGATKNAAGNGYGSAHSTVNNGLGNIKSSANSNGYGSANSHADANQQGALSSVSNSNGQGTAASSANAAPTYTIRGLPYTFNPKASVNTQTSGQGSASARTQGLNSGYRVINSAANSFGHGSAQANAKA